MAQLIAGHSSIEYPIHKRSKLSGQNGSKSILGNNFTFFLRNAESIKFFTRSSRSMETAQHGMPNKSFNTDLRYSEIT